MKMLYMITLAAYLQIAHSSAFAEPASPPSTLSFSETMNPALKKQILDDLKLASQISFTQTSALHQKIFGNYKPGKYLSWFKQRIKRVSVGSCMLSDAAVACVIPLFEKDKIRVTQRYIEMNAPQIARMTVLFHEAKHQEPNLTEHEGDKDRRFWLHDKCPTPFLDENNQPRMSVWTGIELSGKDACDSVAEGAYGTVILMLQNINKNASNVTEKIRADAEIYAKDQLTRIIDSKAHDQIVNDL